MVSPKAAAKQEAPARVGSFKRFLIAKNMIRNADLYVMLIPVILFYAIFCYSPMYGLQLAFKDFVAIDGITGSPWIGFGHFQRFFSSPYFSRLLLNTIGISVLQLAFGFPIPIILALMVNEVTHKPYQKFIQNITYAPYFLSVVVIIGMLKNFVNPDYGIINIAIQALGGTAKNFLEDPDWFKPLYVISGIWQSAGWNSIIFIAALAGVDPQLHESAKIDGAGRFQRIWHVNIPGILPTIIIVLILNVGQIMNIGFEKAFLMQNDLNIAKSDIISTYSYRIGIQGAQYSYATAIGFFNSVVNCILLFTINAFSRKISETSLW